MITRAFTMLALVAVVAAAAAEMEEKPWVTVKPVVLEAGSVVSKITFEGKMPVAAAPGCCVDVEIPYMFGKPQAEDKSAEGYFHARFPAGVNAILIADEDFPRHHILRAVIMGGVLRPGDKFTFFLEREPIHTFNQDERAFGTFVRGPADAKGERLLLARGQATVVNIKAGPPASFRVVVPTCVTPGESFAVKIAVLDKFNNPASSPFAGDVTFELNGLTGPVKARFDKKNDNYLEVPGFNAPAAGVYRVRARGKRLAGESNPAVCRAAWGRRVYWGDIHGHSAFSDGMRQPDQYFDYGRYVGLLDCTVLTDHAENLYEDEWPLFVDIANAKDAPGAFSTLVAYEWTSDAWSGGFGHHCIYFAGRGGQFYSSFDKKSENLEKLYARYDADAVTSIAHHSLAGIKWETLDPRFDRNVEIVSHWGSSEREGNPFWTNRVWPGGGVVDALGAFYLLGFVGGGDNHNGAPGQNRGPSRFPHMPYFGGITGFWLTANSRENIFSALMDRRVYAASGNRDFVDFRVNGAAPVSVVPLSGPPAISADVAAEGVIKSVEVIRGGAPAYAVPDADGKRELTFTWVDEGYDRRPNYYYLRVTSADGHLAFSSPIYVAAGTPITSPPLGALVPGQPVDLPTGGAAGPDLGFAVKTTPSAGGRLAVKWGGRDAAEARVSAEGGWVVVPFRAEPGEWRAKAVFEGDAELGVEEAAVMPYPWMNPVHEGYVYTYEAEGDKLKKSGEIVDDAVASGGKALKVSPADNVYNATVVWGPYDELKPGKYRAAFVLRAEGASSSSRPVFEIEVAAAPVGTTPPKTIASKVVAGVALGGAPWYQQFAVDFGLTEKSACEFKVKYLGAAVLYLDKIELSRVDHD